MLEFPLGIEEVISVGLGLNLARVGLLYKVFIALLLGEVNRLFLGLEVDVCPLHDIPRGLPAHQWVLPAVTLRKNIPIHSPALATPRA